MPDPRQSSQQHGDDRAKDSDRNDGELEARQPRPLDEAEAVEAERRPTSKDGYQPDVVHRAEADDEQGPSPGSPFPEPTD